MLQVWGYDERRCRWRSNFLTNRGDTLLSRDQLGKFEEFVRTRVPGFQLRWKEETWSQKVIGTLLQAFNPYYMVRYISTFYPVVYFPTKEGYESRPVASFMSLAHEYVHLRDTMKHPFWFRLSYLLPQVLILPLLVLGVVLSLYIGWWATPFFVLANVCVLPLPAPWRVNWERRGYAMTLAVNYWLTGTIPPANVLLVKLSFVGWGYYRMSWSEEQTNAWVQRTLAKIYSGQLELEPEYREVHDFMVTEGLKSAIKAST